MLRCRTAESKFKTMKGVILYYSDTDSLVINKPLDPEFVGNEIGKMKLEHTYDKLLCLAAKCYVGKEGNNEHVVIKGSKVKVSLKDIEPLLYKSKILEIHHSKWFRDYSDGSITIKDELYSLTVTDNKRKLIYDDNNRFIDTAPLKLVNGVVTE